MKKDFWMEVNSKNEKLGFKHKKDFLKGEYIHRSVHLILINDGKILLQKRNSNKSLYPDRLTFSVSGAVEDETNLNAIKRESLEELGQKFEVEKLFDFYSQDLGIDKAFRSVYISKYLDEKLTKEDREISKLIWIDLNDLKKELKLNKDKFTPPFYEGMQLFFKQFDSKLL